MVIFYLTNAMLDASLAVTWWTCKQSAYGLYYVASYLLSDNNENIIPIENQDFEEINLNDLDERSKEQKILDEIAKLRNEINNLKD